MTHVGLDLGSTGIRAVQVSRHRSTGRLEVTRAADVDLPVGALHNGAVQDRKAIVSALRSLWRRGRFSTRRVAFALNDSSVLTRQVDLPWMPPDDFAAALRYQVGEALPVDLNSVELGHHVLDEIERTDDLGNPAPLNRILVVAANRDFVTTQANLLRAARLQPVLADSTAFALIRAACGGVASGDRRVLAIADIGADQLTVVIHQGGQPRFIRTIANTGGNSATQALADRLDVEWEVAERIKRETGLNGAAPVVAPIAESSVFRTGAVDVPPDPRVLATLGVLNPWATTVVNEIRNSLDYYQASRPGEPVSTLALVGRTALLDGMRDRIATQIPLPVAPLDPLAGLDAAPRVVRQGIGDTRLTVALGMAMAVTR